MKKMLAACMLMLLTAFHPMAAVFAAAPVVALSAPADSAVLEVCLEDAVRIGIDLSRKLKVSKLERQMSAEKTTEVTSPILPQLTSGVSYTRSLKSNVLFMPSGIFNNPPPGSDASGFYEIEVSPDNMMQATLEFSQSVFNSKAYANIRASSLMERVADEAYREEKDKVVAEVKKSYFEVLISREMLEIVRQSMDRWEVSRKDTQAMYKEGLVADVDTLKAWLSVENIRPDLIEAQNRVGIAMTKLKNAMGLEAEVQLDLTDTLAVVADTWPSTLEAASKEAFAARPDIRQLEYQVRVRDEQESAAHAERLPVLTAFGNLETQSYINDGTVLKDSDWPVSSAVGLQMTLPLFTGYATSSRVAQARISMVQAKTMLEDLRVNVQAELEVRLSILHEALKRIEVQSKTIALAERNYRITLLRYKEGIGSRLELIDAEFQLNTARTNYLKAVYDYLVAGVELDRALGRDFEPKV